MLVLTRKAGESIVLANNIRVMVVEIAPGVVRIGIEAPRDISIVRAELHGAVEGENLRSLKKEPLPEKLLGTLRGKTHPGGSDPPKTKRGHNR